MYFENEFGYTKTLLYKISYPPDLVRKTIKSNFKMKNKIQGDFTDKSRITLNTILEGKRSACFEKKI